MNRYKILPSPALTILGSAVGTSAEPVEECRSSRRSGGGCRIRLLDGGQAACRGLDGLHSGLNGMQNPCQRVSSADGLVSVNWRFLNLAWALGLLGYRLGASAGVVENGRRRPSAVPARVCKPQSPCKPS